MARVLIAGGGTGGHVYPALAVADALRSEREDVELVFVGTPRGIEQRVVAGRGEQLELLDVRPLRGGGLGGFVSGALRAASVLPQARSLVRRLDPDVVFSVGGYAAGPITLAAWSRRVPVTFMEPNSVLGFTNRILAPLIRRAYVGYPETERSLSPRICRYTGVPLRGSFAPAPYPMRERPRVLVMGGSQGALALNETLPRALDACRRQGLPFEVLHQTGSGKDDAVRALYSELGLPAEVVTFIDDVAGSLAEADLVVERAGAGSLAELCAVGRPSILVPYPFAADDHQRHNAESLARDGAAVCVVQSEATVERLTRELAVLLGDGARRRAMAQAAGERGRPEAARAVARDLLALANGEVQAMRGQNEGGRLDGEPPAAAPRLRAPEISEVSP